MMDELEAELQRANNKVCHTGHLLNQMTVKVKKQGLLLGLGSMGHKKTCLRSIKLYIQSSLVFCLISSSFWSCCGVVIQLLKLATKEVTEFTAGSAVH